MKYLKHILLILLLTTTVNALQDINLTVDASNVEFCFCIENLTFCSCRSNQTITIDGTNDYPYYMRPYTAMDETIFKEEGLGLDINKTNNFISAMLINPLQIFLAIIVSVGIVVLTCLVVITVVVKWITRTGS